MWTGLNIDKAAAIDTLTNGGGQEEEGPALIQALLKFITFSRLSWSLTLLWEAIKATPGFLCCSGAVSVKLAGSAESLWHNQSRLVNFYLMRPHLECREMHIRFCSTSCQASSPLLHPPPPALSPFAASLIEEQVLFFVPLEIWRIWFTRWYIPTWDPLCMR